MSDNVVVTAGTGTTVAADEVVDGTLGTVKVQYVKIMDGTLDGTTKVTADSNGLKVNATGLAQGSTTSGQTGNLVLGAVTTNPPTYVDAQTSPASIDTEGYLRTRGRALDQEAPKRAFDHRDGDQVICGRASWVALHLQPECDRRLRSGVRRCDSRRRDARDHGPGPFVRRSCHLHRRHCPVVRRH
jgi:hypothetical protein